MELGELRTSRRVHMKCDSYTNENDGQNFFILLDFMVPYSYNTVPQGLLLFVFEHPTSNINRRTTSEMLNVFIKKTRNK